MDVRLFADGDGLALVFDIEDGWHIYWHNPGDTGMPTVATVNGAEGRFPGPDRFVDADTGFTSYGYAGRTAFFFDRPEGTPAAEAKWLACKGRCVFQEASVGLSDGPGPDLTAVRARLPADVGPTVAADGLTLRVSLDGGPFELFPPTALEERLTAFRATPGGIELDLKAGDPATLPVVLKKADGTFVAFDVTFPGPDEEP